MSTHATPLKRKPSTTKLETERQNDNLFWEIINLYRKLSPYQTLVSSNPDPNGVVKKHTEVFADFLVDVESASRRALQGTGLFYEWQKLANYDRWPEFRVSQRIIRLCANAYRERRLQPDCHSTPSGREGEPPARKSALRRPTRLLCNKHDLQTVTHRIPNPDGNIMLLKCGCNRREDIAAAAPIRGTVVNVATSSASASR